MGDKLVSKVLQHNKTLIAVFSKQMKKGEKTMEKTDNSSGQKQASSTAMMTM